MSDAGSTYTPGRGRFAAVPIELLEDPNVDALGIAVYASLRSFADFGKETGARVSDNRAAGRAKVSRTTFRDRRNALRDLGWIEWRSGAEDGRPNEYRIHHVRENAEGGGGREATTRVAVRRPPGGREATTITESQDREPEPRENGKPIEAPFDKLWTIYLEVVAAPENRSPTLTSKRRKILRRLWDEQLRPPSGSELPRALATWRSTCEAIRDHEWLRQKWDWRLPESALRNEERRERYVAEGILRLEGADVESREEGGTNVQEAEW